MLKPRGEKLLARGLTIEFEKRRILAGDHLRASVKFTLQTPLQAQGLYVDITGITKTQWEDNDSDWNPRTEWVDSTPLQFNEKAVHFQKCFVLGRGESLQAGSHSFPFEYKIPADAPSTFRYSVKTSTTYNCRARLSARDASLDKILTASFDVIARCDLNALPEARQPSNVKKNWKTSVFSTGNVLLDATLPRKGFVSGETVPVNVNLSNQTNKPVLGVKLLINQYIELAARCTTASAFGSSRGKKLKEVMVAEEKVRKIQVDPHSDREMDLEIKIPSLPPTQLSCLLVQIKYAVVVQLLHINKNLNSKVEIILGSLPLTRGQVGVQPVDPQAYLTPSAPVDDRIFDDEEPPPSYDEVTMMKA